MAEEMVTITELRYRIMLTTLDACCLRLGIKEGEEYHNLYNAVVEVDDAVKEYVRDHDDKKIMEWWNKREF